jgi:hypothetical protein
MFRLALAKLLDTFRIEPVPNERAWLARELLDSKRAHAAATYGRSSFEHSEDCAWPIWKERNSRKCALRAACHA